MTASKEIKSLAEWKRLAKRYKSLYEELKEKTSKPKLKNDQRYKDLLEEAERYRKMAQNANKEKQTLFIENKELKEKIQFLEKDNYEKDICISQLILKARVKIKKEESK